MYNKEFDPDQQVTAEEVVASILFYEARNDEGYRLISEEQSQELARAIVKAVVRIISPELMEDESE